MTPAGVTVGPREVSVVRCQIPKAPAAPTCKTSRDFVPGRFSDVGQRQPHARQTDVRETCAKADSFGLLDSGLPRDAGTGPRLRLPGLVMRGSGYGVVGDIIVGLLGAFVGSYPLEFFHLNVRLGNPWLDRYFGKSVVAATRPDRDDPPRAEG